MTWAGRRKLQYILGLFSFLALIAIIILFPMFTKAPTCTDGKQNGGEAGIDCGGSCSRICPNSAVAPNVIWSRAFPLVGNNYNLVALIENPNKDAAIYQANYEFKIYDTNNLLIGRREGKTFIPPNKQFAVFESRFVSGQSEIKSVTFDFIEPFDWIKKAPVLDTLPIYVDNVVQGGDKNSPTLSARINNESIYDLPSFDVIAILYDSNHNAVNASKTYKDGLLRSTNAPVLFTWPEALSGDVVTRDIFTQINPFMINIK